MTEKKLYIAPGCITCGACESVCPEVFKVAGISIIKDDVDVKDHEQRIKKAIEICPVRVIKYEE